MTIKIINIERIGDFMPATINEIGNKYNHLIVTRRDKVKNCRSFWICKCEICGKEYSFSGTALRQNPNHFDCPTCEKVGQQYGRLKVIEYAYTSEDRHKYWMCECECGNREIIKATDLNTSKRVECLICQKKKHKTQYINETGKRYGKLTVLELDTEKSSKNAFWKCKCDCGTLLTVEGTKLRSGHTQSCGCIISTGEFKISQILSNANISFKKQVTFENCLDKKQLRFDFGVYNDNNELQYLIEFDGIQHFGFTEGWNDEQNYKDTKRKDSIKNNYCFINQIPLIRIPYYHQNSLSLNDLLLKTSKYIVKDQ